MKNEKMVVRRGRNRLIEIGCCLEIFKITYFIDRHAESIVFSMNKLLIVYVTSMLSIATILINNKMLAMIRLHILSDSYWYGYYI